MQTQAGNPNGRWNYWYVYWGMCDTCAWIDDKPNRSTETYGPIHPRPIHPHTHIRNSVYAEYTIKDANNVAVHNYANENSVNGIIHDVNLCAYVRDPTNNPGALAVAPCGIPSVSAESGEEQQHASHAAHKHHSPFEKFTHHMCFHALHERSSLLAHTGLSTTVRTETRV